MSLSLNVKPSCSLRKAKVFFIQSSSLSSGILKILIRAPTSTAGLSKIKKMVGNKRKGLQTNFPK
jgi:hypothetical protein